MSAVRAYTPPPLNPLQARFCNALLTRDVPRVFDVHGRPCSFDADPWQTPFVPVCGLTLDVRGETWQALFSSAAPMALHPAGMHLVETPELPEGLRLALFELSLSPVLSALAGFFGLDNPPAILAEERAPVENSVCAVPLALRLPRETVAVSLRVPGREAAETILRRLEQEKRRVNPVPPLFLAIVPEVGSMRLTVAELSALHPNDIVLPESYPGLEGRIRLRLVPDCAIHCTVAGGVATVLGVECGTSRHAGNEMRREKMADTPLTGASQEQTGEPGGRTTEEPRVTADATHAEPLDVNSLELEVTFELDRRLMSVTEITALVPGYTFALPADPAGPVTVRVNGKRLGTGRLVEIGGALGVQLVGMERE